MQTKNIPRRFHGTHMERRSRDHQHCIFSTGFSSVARFVGGKAMPWSGLIAFGS
jgi:hypothetical protein